MILLIRHFFPFFLLYQDKTRRVKIPWKQMTFFLLHCHFERVMYQQPNSSYHWLLNEWTNIDKIAIGMKALFRGFILLHGLKSFHPHNLKVALKVSMFESTMIRLKKVLNFVWLFFTYNGKCFKRTLWINTVAGLSCLFHWVHEKNGIEQSIKNDN